MTPTENILTIRIPEKLRQICSQNIDQVANNLQQLGNKKLTLILKKLRCSLIKLYHTTMMVNMSI